MILKNKVYDGLKFQAQIVLPALGTLYFALASIWGLPAATEVIGTIAAVDTFLGVVLGISKRNYDNSDAAYGGTLALRGHDPDTGIPHLALTVTKPPEELLSGNVVRLKVEPGDV
jgi:hypothetical protein